MAAYGGVDPMFAPTNRADCNDDPRKRRLRKVTTADRVINKAYRLREYVDAQQFPPLDYTTELQQDLLQEGRRVRLSGIKKI
jgi:hypothetical protein